MLELEHLQQEQKGVKPGPSNRELATRNVGTQTTIKIHISIRPSRSKRRKSSNRIDVQRHSFISSGAHRSSVTSKNSALRQQQSLNNTSPKRQTFANIGTQTESTYTRRHSPNKDGTLKQPLTKTKARRLSKVSSKHPLPSRSISSSTNTVSPYSSRLSSKSAFPDTRKLFLYEKRDKYREKRRRHR
ncbi:unnamed protein product [Didymodactylos carnosus]|uniref:Uncharacterized protein n=1 Tax=Didymodactylos carnosus TaxID=1234261 RepID=A0A815DIQ7_9BILA|nr:unnamed protein product [Didymodactylos carnosus]CAF1297617.1 unnamed protein product [Didymodactylos carnosus]CAF3856476.1 unnamed protein product [Didymodactylos carnosus]CAF4115048.1 unnamed protein product [Didymodactylos carnosus]